MIGKSPNPVLVGMALLSVVIAISLRLSSGYLSLIEVWIDETERRAWFLFEASRQADSSGH